MFIIIGLYKHWTLKVAILQSSNLCSHNYESLNAREAHIHLLTFVYQIEWHPSLRTVSYIVYVTYKKFIKTNVIEWQLIIFFFYKFKKWQ